MVNTLKHLVIIFVVLAVAAAIFRYEERSARPPATPPGSGVACTQEAKLCPDGSYVGRTGPKCEFAACPQASGAAPIRMNFGTAYTLRVDEPIMFTDGFAITIAKIGDSRCKPGVQCIWAGELSTTLNTWGGALGEAVQEVHLGTISSPSATDGGYNLILDDITTTTATITVTKDTSSTTGMGYVSGHINIGPFCPAEREGVPCPVPPSAYSSRQVVVYKADGVTIKEKGKIDVAGNYKIALAPGTYYIQIDPAGIGAGEKKQVIVSASKTSVVDFSIDTGIR